MLYNLFKKNIGLINTVFAISHFIETYTGNASQDGYYQEDALHFVTRLFNCVLDMERKLSFIKYLPCFLIYIGAYRLGFYIRVLILAPP